MISITRRLRQSLLIVATLGLANCASLDSQRERTPDPNQRLDQLLAIYHEARQNGSNCQEGLDADTGVIDCSRVQREVDRLYAEFPKQERIIMANAVMQYEAGRRENSQFLLDQLLSMPGPHPEAAILRSRIAMEEGNSSRAKVLLREQINLAPDYAELHEAMASALYLEGKYIEAIDALKVAELLAAPAWRIAYHRGVIHEALSNPQLACNEYQFSLNQMPRYKPALARLLGLSGNEACREIFQRINSIAP